MPRFPYENEFVSKIGYKPRQPRTLKEATSLLIGAVGGLKDAAEHCRVQGTSLFRYTDDSDENSARYMPVDIVQVLEKSATFPFVTEFLATQVGYLLVPIAPDDSSELTLDVVETGEKAAQLFKSWAEFIGNDGLIDREEAHQLLRVNQALVRTLMRMRSDLEATIADPNTPQGIPIRE